MKFHQFQIAYEFCLKWVGYLLSHLASHCQELIKSISICLRKQFMLCVHTLVLPWQDDSNVYKQHTANENMQHTFILHNIKMIDLNHSNYFLTSRNMYIWFWPPETPLLYSLQGYLFIFSFLFKNMDCGYLLEPPHRGSSDMFRQSMFWAEMGKISDIFNWKFSSFDGKIFNKFV